MAVRVFLISGACRVVETADGARLTGPFFEINETYRKGHVYTVLTLRAAEVVGAEIVKDGQVVDYVLGGAERRE